MKQIMIALALGGVIALTADVHADPWKDESGHGRRGPPPWAENGEPPDWARGKGVWDGHATHDRRFPPPGHQRPWHEEWRSFGSFPPPYRYDRRYYYPHPFDSYDDRRPLRFYGEGRATFRWEAWW